MCLNYGRGKSDRRAEVVEIRKKLVHVKHNMMDAFSYPLFISCIALIGGYGLFSILYFVSIKFNYPRGDVVLQAILVFIIALILFLVFSLTALRLEVHKDEELWLHGEEIEYICGKKWRLKYKVKDVKEIYLIYKRVGAPTILFRMRSYEFMDVGFDHALRKWCNPDELERIGIEIWKELRKINPEIKLKRKFYTTGYREEYYDGEKWVPARK